MEFLLYFVVGFVTTSVLYPIFFGKQTKDSENLTLHLKTNSATLDCTQNILKGEMNYENI